MTLPVFQTLGRVDYVINLDYGRQKKLTEYGVNT